GGEGLDLKGKGLGSRIDDFVNASNANGFVKDAINAVSALPDIVTKAGSGDVVGATQDGYFVLFGSESAKIGAAQLLHLFVEFLGLSASPGFVATYFEKMNKILGAVDMLLQATDSAFQAMDIARSENASQWDVTITKSLVALNPQELLLPVGALPPTVKASTDATVQEGQIFVYDWKCAQGKFSTGQATLTSNSDTVTYDVSGLVAGFTDEISLSLSQKGAGSSGAVVGTAKIPVSIYQIQVTPGSKKIKAQETLTLKADVAGMRPLKTGEKLTYKWLTTRNAGELIGSPDGGINTPVEGQSVTYRAAGAQTGADNVTVEVFLGTRSLGKSVAQVTVGETVEGELAYKVVLEAFTRADYTNNGLTFPAPVYADYVTGVVSSYLVVPIVPGVTTYTITYNLYGNVDKPTIVTQTLKGSDVESARSFLETVPLSIALADRNLCIPATSNHSLASVLFFRRGDNLYLSYILQYYPYFVDYTTGWLMDEGAARKYMTDTYLSALPRWDFKIKTKQ
ncbi:hypothetical protein, partial [Armatimonas sp.]|uniref:hypothetical protein n=1 Tax=Armatimonas sp. TaxID=1872638 RepID=UPI00286CF439